MNVIARLPLIRPLIAVIVMGASFASAQLADLSTEPQVVRVRFVTGDVRISRGKDAEKAGAAPWEQAAPDLPIESGYSLVTGEGRAEVEFEDASVLSLAPNSVLEFIDLASFADVPHTEVALLSGMATVDFIPSGIGDEFFIRTPTDRVGLRYPGQSSVRVNALLDATMLTGSSTVVLHFDRMAAIQAPSGVPVVVASGQRLFPDPAPDPHQYDAWDSWVETRTAERHAEMQAAMKQAHLRTPIPGLAEMNGQGHFFDCAPYGTCWEPNGEWPSAVASEDPATQTADSQAVAPRQQTAGETAALARQTVSVNTLQQGGPIATGSPLSSTLHSPRTAYDDVDFPCWPWWERAASLRNRLNPYSLNPSLNPYPYRWAVCHTGSFIRTGRRYVWVVGRHPHHREPCLWVKTSKGVGIVPIHPKDGFGRPPNNLKNGVLIPPGKHDAGVLRTAWSDSDKFKLLDEPPKNFRKDAFTPLNRSSEPRVLAYHLDNKAAPARDGVKVAAFTAPAGLPITFDHKSQNFVVAHEVHLNSGVTRTVAEPIGGRNSTLQMRASAPAIGGGQRSSSFIGGSGPAASHAAAAASASFGAGAGARGGSISGGAGSSGAGASPSHGGGSVGASAPSAGSSAGGSSAGGSHK